ncbi:hypothetical protein PC119_g26951, partial [Phytophthora cactorum]
VKAVQTSNADEAAIKTEILGFAAAKEGAKMSDESMAKISKMLAENEKKNPTIYGAYKLLFSKDTSASTTTTTIGTTETDLQFYTPKSILWWKHHFQVT